MLPKTGIIAGRGVLPVLILDAIRAEGRPAFVLGLEGQTDPNFTDNVEHAWVKIGAIGSAIDALKAANVEDVVFAGGVTRPSLMGLGLDGRATKLLAKAGMAALGDDRLLSILVRELEGEGLRVIGADDLLEGLLAQEGVFGKHRPDAEGDKDIARGLDVARAIGGLDIGQAVVVQQGFILGVEAAEGTDALISRTASLHREGPGGVLVKVKKPGQERRVDLPTIGLGTIKAAIEAGLSGIAVEAGSTFILDRDETRSVADDAGLFIVALSFEK
ncbi:MAG: UDP-2,3-diacylglucosamine diphosphatase LpxI [Rhodospirillales bacterium]|nr:UDP-2,3-diacylglucosamine diphosphatase LpxI [Rhodospirillales bacterium]